MTFNGVISSFKH